MKPLFKSARRFVKKITPHSRSHSPASSDRQLDRQGRTQTGAPDIEDDKKRHSPASSDHHLDRQADRPSNQTNTLYAPISDNSASRSKSVTSFILGRTQVRAPDIKDDKNRTPSAATSAPSKKFVDVKTMNAQHDLVVLHVAYILQNSPGLRNLILEIVGLSKRHNVRESYRCTFV